MSKEPPEGLPKLLVVLPASAIGGAETRTFNLLKGLQRFERVLLTQDYIADFYRGLDARVYRFDEWQCTTPYELSLANTLRYARAIGAVARREKPDLILALMHNGTLFAAAARDLFFPRTVVIGTILGNLSAYFHAEGRKPSWWERSIFFYCVRRPDAVITNSHGVRSDLIAHFGASGDRLSVIHNGIDLARCRDRAALQQPPLFKDRPWIVSACRLEGQKDFPTLLRAFREVLHHHPARLILVGEGQQRGEILRMASELGIADDTTLTGFQENPFPWIAAADVFILSSFYEGFGNVIVEAMALGKPVIASDCPSGPGEIIENGKSGILVPVEDWGAMAERCLELLVNPALRADIAQRGVLRAEQFGLAAMVSAFDRCLGQSVRRSPRCPC